VLHWRDSRHRPIVIGGTGHPDSEGLTRAVVVDRPTLRRRAQRAPNDNNARQLPAWRALPLRAPRSAGTDRSSPRNEWNLTPDLPIGGGRQPGPRGVGGRPKRSSEGRRTLFLPPFFQRTRLAPTPFTTSSASTLNHGTCAGSSSEPREDCLTGLVISTVANGAVILQRGLRQATSFRSSRTISHADLMSETWTSCRPTSLGRSANLWSPAPAGTRPGRRANTQTARPTSMCVGDCASVRRSTVA
jgi:hypothetical protein